MPYTAYIEVEIKTATLVMVGRLNKQGLVPIVSIILIERLIFLLF
jgi:hypothetical protein